MLGYYGMVIIAAVAVLAVANSRPHSVAPASEEESTGAPVEQLTAQQATANFPADEVAALRTISEDTLSQVTAGDSAAAKSRATDLETAWDDAQDKLEPLDGTAWKFLDSEIDDALTAVRDTTPDVDAEKQALTTLIASLTP
jgi:hypothetical protein